MVPGALWEVSVGGGGGEVPKQRKRYPKVSLEMLVNLHKVGYLWDGKTVFTICVLFVLFIFFNSLI